MAKKFLKLPLLSLKATHKAKIETITKKKTEIPFARYRRENVSRRFLVTASSKSFLRKEEVVEARKQTKVIVAGLPKEKYTSYLNSARSRVYVSWFIFASFLGLSLYICNIWQSFRYLLYKYFSSLKNILTLDNTIHYLFFYIYYRSSKIYL